MTTNLSRCRLFYVLFIERAQRREYYPQIVRHSHLPLLNSHPKKVWRFPHNFGNWHWLLPILMQYLLPPKWDRSARHLLISKQVSYWMFYLQCFEDYDWTKQAWRPILRHTAVSQWTCIGRKTHERGVGNTINFRRSYQVSHIRATSWCLRRRLWAFYWSTLCQVFIIVF